MKVAACLMAIAFVLSFGITACDSSGGGGTTLPTADASDVKTNPGFDTAGDPGTNPNLDVPVTPGDDVPVADEGPNPDKDTTVPPKDDGPGKDTGPGPDPGRDCTDAELQAAVTCLQGCTQGDNDCAKKCYEDNMSAACLAANAALEQCAAGSGCAQTDTACIEGKCKDQWAKVFGASEPTGDAPSPYGTVTANFTTDYVRNASDPNTDAAGVQMTAFATGTFGKNSTAIPPAGAQIQAFAGYFTDPQGNVVEVQQLALMGGAPANPMLVVDFKMPVAVGDAVSIGLDQADAGAMILVDVNWTTSQIACMHGFAVGTVAVTDVGDVTNHGSFAFNGTIDLFHPSNVNGQNVSSQLPIPVCDVQ